MIAANQMGEDKDNFLIRLHHSSEVVGSILSCHALFSMSAGVSSGCPLTASALFRKV